MEVLEEVAAPDAPEMVVTAETVSAETGAPKEAPITEQPHVLGGSRVLELAMSVGSAWSKGRSENALPARLGGRQVTGLLYSSTRDGPSGEAFHSLCADKGALLILVAVKGTDGGMYVFAGFAPSRFACRTGTLVTSVAVNFNAHGVTLQLWGDHVDGTALVVIGENGPIVGMNCVWAGPLHEEYDFNTLGTGPEGPGFFTPEEVEVYGVA